MRQENKTSRATLLGLFLILIFSTWLRLPGLSSGLPYFTNEDEAHHFNRTVDMVKDGTLDPKYFHKPSLHFYLRMPVVWAWEIYQKLRGAKDPIKSVTTHDNYGLAKYSFSASHPTLIVLTRAVSLALGLLLIVISFFVMKSFSEDPAPALITAAIVGVSPDLVEHSTIVGVDLLMALTSLISVWLALVFFDTWKTKHLFACAVFCGLAVSSKYNALPIIALPIAVCLLEGQLSKKHLLISLVVPMLAFLLGSPAILLTPKLFYQHLSYEVWHYSVAGHQGNEGQPGISQVYFYFNWLQSSALGVPALAISILGLIAILPVYTKKALVFLIFPTLFFLEMVLQKVNFTRNMLVLIPFFAVLCGFVVKPLARLQNIAGHILCLCLLPVFTLQPLFQSLELRSEQYGQPDTRQLLLQWMQEHISPNSDIAVAGQLQLPSSAYNAKGVARFNQKLINPIDLYLSGFDYLVFSGQLPGFSNTPEIALQKLMIPGSAEEQRIVSNPQIFVYQFHQFQPEKVEQLIAAHLQTTPWPPLVFTTDGCFRAPGTETLLKQEGHCWIERRYEELWLEVPQHLRSKNELTYTLEYMSPWPNQKVTAQSINSSYRLNFPADSTNTWQTFSFKSELSHLEDGYLKLKVRTEQVKSPKDQGVNSDNRRLGFALRRVSIE